VDEATTHDGPVAVAREQRDPGGTKMHRDEADQLTHCMDCGSELAPGNDRDFQFGSQGTLCWACAERRGGRYDERRSLWIREPDVLDLARSAADVD
jgi:hypothetical protein